MNKTDWRNVGLSMIVIASLASAAQSGTTKGDNHVFDQAPLRLAAADIKSDSSSAGTETRIVESSGGEDGEDEMEDLQSFNTWTSLEDGQPGQRGEFQINHFTGWTTSSHESDPWLNVAEIEYSPTYHCGNWFLNNAKFGIDMPFELMNGGVDGNFDLAPVWKQRLIKEEMGSWWPTVSIENELRLPTGYHSSGVDWTIEGVVAKQAGPGTAVFNAWLECANGHNNLDTASFWEQVYGESDGDDLRNFQWGFRWGYKWRISDKFSLVADYVLESSQLRGNHNHNIGEISAEWRLTDHLYVGPGILFGLDGAGETPNFGAGVTIHYEFFPFKCGA